MLYRVPQGLEFTQVDFFQPVGDSGSKRATLNEISCLPAGLKNTTETRGAAFKIKLYEIKFYKEGRRDRDLLKYTRHVVLNSNRQGTASDFGIINLYHVQ